MAEEQVEAPLLELRDAALGYGEHQPVAAGDDPESLARNRRIEVKFTERPPLVEPEQ